MDQELKQRLIGAVVVTALAAIFIPMLFDDPVDQSGQVVSELVIPEAPVKASEDAANKLPANADEVLAQPDQGLTQEETEATINEPSDTIAQSGDDVESVDAGIGTAAEEPIDESVEEPVVAEPDINQKAQDTAVVEETVQEPVVNPPKSTPKQKHAVKPAPVEVVKQAEKPAVERVAPRAKPAPKQERAFKVEEPMVAQPKPAHVVKPVQPKVAAVEKPVAEAVVTPPKAAAKPESNVKPSTAKVVEPAKSTASADKVASAKPAAALSRWYIQVGSYGQEANAMAMWNALRKQGFPVLLETIHNQEKGTLYRLKVGPELDQKRAAAMKEKLDKQNNLKTMLRAE